LLALEDRWITPNGKQKILLQTVKLMRYQHQTLSFVAVLSLLPGSNVSLLS